MIFLPSNRIINPLLIRAANSLPTVTIQAPYSTIARIEGVFSLATIRAYFADFIAFIAFYDFNNQSTLSAYAKISAHFILHISASGRSSASIRRVVAGISAIHLFNRFADLIRDPEMRIEMKRMHRTPGRSDNQA